MTRRASRPSRARPPTSPAAPSTAAEPAAPRPARPKAADGYVAVAEVARPHGIQGELRLKVYNPDSDLLLRKPRAILLLSDGETRDVAITAARESNKAILVRLAGVDDRNAAEVLRGAELCVPRDAFPALEEGEFYASDLEGARAVMRSGDELGRVTGVTSYPTCDVLVVERTSGGRLEIPLLDAFVGKVDVANGVVEVVTVEGLD
jgi:16S rRNA processing protein RimM